MRQTFTGQCQCGAVRYTVTGKQATAFVCHCSDCQRQSASAFGMAAWVAEAEVKLEQGELREWVRHTPGGKQMVCQFCGVCGSRLFHRVLGSSHLSIKPGSLDDPSQCQPVAHIWTRSKQPWMEIAQGLLQFEGNPDGMETLMQAWALAHTTNN